jgi:hypothetical protein
MHEKADRGVRLNADDFRRGAGCAAHHKMLLATSVSKINILRADGTSRMD